MMFRELPMFREEINRWMEGNWESVLAIVLFGVVVGVAGLIRPRPLRATKTILLAITFLLFLVTVLAVQGMALSDQTNDTALRYGLRLAFAVGLIVGLPRVLSPREPNTPIRLSVALVVGGLLTGGVLIYRGVNAQAIQSFHRPDEGQSIDVTEVAAYTDRGTLVPLMTRVGGQSSTDDDLLLSPSLLDRRPYMGRVIQVGPPDTTCLCHGWTFCGGRYMLAYPDVDRILRENAYQQVEQPQPGDLVIYRDLRRGIIVHSGVVKAVGKDNYVLVESKWALRGRYLHEPALQPYSLDFAYYRSERSGHLLLGLRPSSTNAPTVSSPPTATPME